MSLQSRCHQYWPDEEGDILEFGKISVILVETEKSATYIRRKMMITSKIDVVSIICSIVLHSVQLRH